MQGPEKNSYKEFDNEKKFLQLENSPPPTHNVSNGPSLRANLLNNNKIYNYICLIRIRLSGKTGKPG